MTPTFGRALAPGDAGAFSLRAPRGMIYNYCFRRSTAAAEDLLSVVLLEACDLARGIVVDDPTCPTDPGATKEIFLESFASKSRNSRDD